jgi:hypothetical protein
MAVSGLHPFQRFELEHLPAWQHLCFNERNVQADEATVDEIEAAFREAVHRHNPRLMLRAYMRRARDLLARSDGDPLVYEILCEALARLIFYYLFMTRRGRPALAADGSACTWNIAPELLRATRARADELERLGERTSEYYALSEDRPLSDWVRHNVRPLVESYVGSSAVSPHAHIRVVTTERYADTWQHMYQEHPFGYFHWDELCYSIPLIIYLDDVGLSDGPYAFVEGSDKMPQNLTLRAFAQAVSCKLLPAARIDEQHRAVVAALPRVFRVGERVGSHLDRQPFDAAGVRYMTGVAGTAILSDGFSLVHGGGHPSAGRRRALFVAHRFPRKRLLDLCATAGRRWWRWRVPQPRAAAPQPGARGEVQPR